jgi:hypothetical protein
MVGLILLIVLFNHVFIFTHPLYILAFALFLIISSSLFMFYSAKEEIQAHSLFFNNMDLMSLVCVSGTIILLIEFFVPYHTNYTGYMLSTETSTLFFSVSMNLFTGAVILIGLGVGGLFLYMLYELFTRKMCDTS